MKSIDEEIVKFIKEYPVETEWDSDTKKTIVKRRLFDILNTRFIGELTEELLSLIGKRLLWEIEELPCRKGEEDRRGWQSTDLKSMCDIRKVFKDVLNIEGE